MKKILTALVALFLLLTNVEAATNELFFEEKDGKLYYDTDRFDEDIFISHHDIVPGKEYKDTLVIKNESKNTYDLYLRVNNIKQDLLADELIDNMFMEIYVDGNLVYDGEARGTEYDNNGLKIKQMILLGTYEPNEVKDLVVVTKLSEEYDNTKNLSTAAIEWEFFAGYRDGVQPIVPKPNGEISMRTVITALAALIFVLVTVLVYRKKNGTNKKMRTKKERE